MHMKQSSLICDDMVSDLHVHVQKAIRTFLCKIEPYNFSTWLWVISQLSCIDLRWLDEILTTCMPYYGQTKCAWFQLHISKHFINPFVPRKTKIVYTFGLSECKRFSSLIFFAVFTESTRDNFCNFLKKVCFPATRSLELGQSALRVKNSDMFVMKYRVHVVGSSHIILAILYMSELYG